MNWEQLTDEAVRHLQGYLRINTVNPPGREMEAALFFKRIFEAESLPCELFEPEPGRGNVLATLRGTGKKRPILLLNHMDVVPVDKENWDMDPFEGVIKGGMIYGRGALDDKSMGIVEMMALLALKRAGTPLERDVLFLGTADEEVGGKWGVEWAVKHLPSIAESEFAINEGGYVILNESGLADRYEVSSGQKVIFQLELKARGTSGHGSMPHSDNPNVKLVHALERITTWETPFIILPMVEEFFSKIASKQPPDKRDSFKQIKGALEDPSFSRWLTSNPIYNAMVRNTISLTVLRAGSKVNVIPSDSTALLDCRLIPGASKEDFFAEVKKRAGNDIDVGISSESQTIPASPLDTGLFQAICRFAEENDPGCPVVPQLLSGATDSRFLREKGIITYDFCPFRLTEKELMRVHGNNERIALDNLKFGMRMLTALIQEITG
jgi:acetylornithine deacetylase/succinyl-diaminopimelate desuccinylase-like protein